MYNAPSCVDGGNLTIAGLSVTGNGFGTWTYSFAVTGSDCTKASDTASSGQTVGKSDDDDENDDEDNDDNDGGDY